LSFFDEGEDESTTRSAAARPARSPRPRRGSDRVGGAPDRQTLMIRRAVAGGIGLIVLILIVLGVSSCQKSAERSALRSYSRDVNAIGQASERNVGAAFFNDLQQASANGALATEVNINQLHVNAQNEVSRARALSVPGPMAGAQRNLLLTLDLREAALRTVAAQITAAMGGTDATQAVQTVAGEMEVLLASDVLHAERVVPLIEQALGDHGIHDQAAVGSRWLQSLDWLQPSTVGTALTGVAGTGSFGGAVAPGPHGHRLVSAVAGGSTLTPGAVNHVTGGGNPVFTVAVANVGANPETNVKVAVTVVAQGVTRSATQVIPKTLPGKTSTVNVTVPGVPVGVPGKVTANVARVPGELSVVHNHQTYTVIFSP
jgi:hypothetical protein